MLQSIRTFGLYFFIGIVLYGVSLQSAFLFDDQVVIQNNSWLHWSFLPHFFRSFINDSSMAFPGFRPFVMATFVIDNELFGLSPWAFRLHNLILLCGLSTLVFLWARRWTPLAFFVGLLFLIHPVQTNVVMLVWKRTDIYVGLGLFGSLYLFTNWVEAERGKIFQLLSGYCFLIVAFLSKESALIALPSLCFFESLVWKSKRSWAQRVGFIYVPLVILSCLQTYVVFFAFPQTLASIFYQAKPFMPQSQLLSQPQYFYTQMACVLEYIKILFVPVHLNLFHYIPPIQHFSELRFLLGSVFILFLLVGAFLCRKKFSLVSAMILLTLLLFIPSSSFIPLNLPFDEDRLCLPLFPISLLFVFLLGPIIQKRWEAKAGVLTLFLLLGVGTFLRAQEWRSDITFWMQNVADEPNDPRVWAAFGKTMENHSRFTDAVKAFEKAIQIDPRYGIAYFAKGQNLKWLGKYPEAQASLQMAVQIDGPNSPYLNQLSEIALLQGNSKQALHFLNQALEKTPNDVISLQNLSQLQEKMGAVPESYRTIRKAFLINPEEPQTQYFLAHLLWKYEKNTQDAKELLKEVLRKQPKNEKAEALLQEILLLERK